MCCRNSGEHQYFENLSGRKHRRKGKRSHYSSNRDGRIAPTICIGRSDSDMDQFFGFCLIKKLKQPIACGINLQAIGCFDLKSSINIGLIYGATIRLWSVALKGQIAQRHLSVSFYNAFSARRKCSVRCSPSCSALAVRVPCISSARARATVSPRPVLPWWRESSGV